MKITEVEVKTIYTIQFGFEDFAQAVEDYFDEGSDYDILYPRAFDGLTDGPKVTIAEAHEILSGRINRMTSSGLRYLANRFGFDGWENAGYWNNRDKLYRMVVYNHGDTIKN